MSPNYPGGMWEWTIQSDLDHYSLVMVPYGSPQEPEGHIGIYLGNGKGVPLQYRQRCSL